MPEHQGRRKSPLSGEDDWFDRAFMAFVHRVSGRSIVVVSLALYPGLGLALPLVLGAPTPWLVYANLVCVTWAALLSVGWLLAQLEAAHRRHLLEWTTDLRHLTAEEFEWFVGEVFRREAWDVKETGRQDRSDGNVDLILTRGKERLLVQCKRWTSWEVGVNEIRAFAGTLHAEKQPDARGVFVTLSQFTSAAEQEAKRSRIMLVGPRELNARAESVRRTEPCPVCQQPMIFDRSQHGWWFRCITPGCGGKRDLTGEPARVVDLLTERPWISEASDSDA